MIKSEKQRKHLEKLAKNRRGKKHSSKTKEKISKAHLGKKISEEKKKVFNFRGRRHSEETRKRISKALIGKKKSKEQIRKLVEKLKGRKASKESRLKMSIAHYKQHGSKYKKKTKKGYILCFEPEHPNKNSGSRIFEHRLVMEKKLGRYLTKNEIVHHLNRKKDDNRIGNLYLVKSIKEHHQKEVIGLNCPHCKRDINIKI